MLSDAGIEVVKALPGLRPIRSGRACSYLTAPTPETASRLSASRAVEDRRSADVSRFVRSRVGLLERYGDAGEPARQPFGLGRRDAVQHVRVDGVDGAAPAAARWCPCWSGAPGVPADVRGTVPGGQARRVPGRARSGPSSGVSRRTAAPARRWRPRGGGAGCTGRRTAPL